MKSFAAAVAAGVRRRRWRPPSARRRLLSGEKRRRGAATAATAAAADAPAAAAVAQRRFAYPPYAAAAAAAAPAADGADGVRPRPPHPPPSPAHPTAFFRADHTIADFRAAWDHLHKGERCPGSSVSLAGRVVSKREASKKLYFVDIESGGARVQVMADERHFEAPAPLPPPPDRDAGGAAAPATGAFHAFRPCLKELRRGDVVGVTGFPARAQRGELSLVPRGLHWLAPCNRELPAAGEWHSVADPNLRFRCRPLDWLANPASRQTLRTRFRVVSLLRRFLEDRGFVEAETPVLSFSAGGAAAESFTTRAHALGSRADRLHLRIAPELYLKQLVVGGFDRVFEVGKVFRNEGIDATHNPEFTTCEFYAAYAEYEELMGLTEEMLRAIEAGVVEAQEQQQESGAAAAGRGGGTTPPPGSPPRIFGGGGSDGDGPPPPFPRVSVYDALERRLGVDLPAPTRLGEDPAALDELLAVCAASPLVPDMPEGTPRSAAKVLDHLIGELLEPACQEPTFLCDHPAIMSPLAKGHRSRPGLTERFELFVRGKELCNAYTELNDPREQRARFDAQRAMRRDHGDTESHGVDEPFCEALEYGLPPTAGWGIGVDRLVMLLTGHGHIREVLPFPLMKDHGNSKQHDA